MEFKMATVNNVTQNNDLILNLTLEHFANSKGILSTIKKNISSDRFARTGGTVSIRQPQTPTTRNGAEAIFSPIVEQVTSMQVLPLYGSDDTMTDFELTTTMPDETYFDEIMRPKVEAIASNINADIHKMAVASLIRLSGQNQMGAYDVNGVFNVIGDPTAAITTIDPYFDAGAVLTEEGCKERTDRFIVITPRAQARLASTNSTLFNPQSKVSDYFNRGIVDGMLGGFEFIADDQVPTRTSGICGAGGAPKVNGANQSGTTLVLDGFAANATINAGDIFTISGVNSVNPVDKSPQTRLHQFRVMANATASGGGAVTLTVFPALTVTAPLQNVSALPVNNADIVFLTGSQATYSTMLAYHREAFEFTTIPLPIAHGTTQQQIATSDKMGLSLRWTRGFDINAGRHVNRLETQVAYCVKRPERLVGLLTSQ